MASDAAATPATASDAAAAVPAVPAKGKPAPVKRRGSYNCGRCGVPKKGHVCSFAAPVPAASASASASGASTRSGSGGGGGGDAAAEPLSLPRPPPRLPQSQPQTKPRRALQFDDPSSSSASSPPQPAASAAAAAAVVLDAVPLAVMAPPPRSTPPPPPAAAAANADGDGDGEDYPRLPWVEVGSGRRLPGWVVMEVLRRLPPRGIAAGAGVSRGWREVARHVWEDTEEVWLRAAGVRPVAALMARCPALARLVLTMNSDVDSTLLACIAFSCPNLQSLEIRMSNSAANRITGDELSRFVSERRSLSVLKLVGCSSLGFLNVSTSSLSTLWLSGLCSLTKAVMNCPNLTALALDFPPNNNDSTDLVALMESVGNTCPNLRSMHVKSIHLCNNAVLALENDNLRGLRMLSLILGKKITDVAVVSIVRCYLSLEVLDLSGSGITDNGVGMISNAFPNTLTHLQLAMCSNVTSFGVQIAAARLPLLHLMDCGRSMCATPQPKAGRSYFGDLTGGIKFCSKLPVQRKQQTTCQQLIITHNTLKKLSLWDCSAIDTLYVNCPELVDLNLNFCTNLNPERLQIQCPKLKDVHVKGCRDMLIGAVRNQVLNEFAAIEPRVPCKRLADGSKRVHVPHFMIEQLEGQEKWGKRRKGQCTVHLN